MSPKPDAGGQPDQVEVSAQDARAGATPHVARYVPIFSLALVVIAFAAILLGYLNL